MDLLAAIPVLGKILDKVLPDPAARDAAKLQLVQLAQNGELEVIRGQVAINVAEAANPSLFVSGWRPAVGWICAAAFGYSVLLLPLLSWLSVIWGWQVPPSIDTGEIVMLLIGMLGLGTMRTAEKIQGVARR